MYIFMAHYINIETDTERMAKIELDGQFFSKEKEIYAAAMIRAYDMRDVNEILADLEFIAC